MHRGGDLHPDRGDGIHFQLDAAYNDGFQAQTLTAVLSGTGIAPAKLVFDSPTFNYGSIVIGNSSDHTFTVTNQGQTQATGIAATNPTAPFSFKGGAYPGGGTCGTTLAPAATCTVVVTFAPTAATASTSNLMLAYNDGFQAQTLTAVLSGAGLAPAKLVIDSPNFNYGSVVIGNSVDHTFTITNQGLTQATGMAATNPTAPSASKAVLTRAAEPAAPLSLRPRPARWW